MKTLNKTFTEEEYTKLLLVKQDKTWHDFILSLVEETNEDKI